jgi:3-O-methylgallate 3,4-dioxygenase
MAQIIIGAGTPKSPQVSLPPDHWLAHGDADRIGLEAQFDRVVATRGAELSRQLTPAMLEERFQACQREIARIATTVATAEPDVLVIFGDEDRDVSSDQSLAPISIFSGEAVTIEPLSDWTGPEYNRPAMWAWYGEQRANYPVAVDLANYLLESLSDRGFDVACSRGQPSGVSFNSSFSFVVRRILGEANIPIVPITLNAQFQHNQPTPRRCFDLGVAVGHAVRDWPSELRVGVIGVGGLSHRMIDEELDHQVLNAMRLKQADVLRGLRPDRLTSGTGEVRCWIAAAGALQSLQMTLLSYQPCYRSLGGTGCGMAFATWM